MANTIKVGLANVRGLLAHGGAKLANISSLLEDTNLDVLCLCETHLGPQDSLRMDDTKEAYTIHRVDRAFGRNNHRFGGVAIVSRERLGAVDVQLPRLQHGTEAVAIELGLPQGGKMCITSVYHPNGGTVMDLELIQTLEHAYDHLVVCGDFNAKHPDWGVNTTSNQNGDALRDFLLEESLLQLFAPDEATWISPGENSRAKSTLDLFLVSPQVAGGAALEILGDIGSDHQAISILLEVSCVQDRNPPPVARFRFRDADWVGYADTLEQLLMGRGGHTAALASPQDLDATAALVKDCILDAANLHIPKRQGRQRQTPTLPLNIARLRQRRSHLLRRIAQGEFWLKPERNRLSRLITRLVNEHRAWLAQRLCDEIDEREPSQKFTKRLQAARGRQVERPLRVDGTILRTSEEKSEAFASSLAESFQVQEGPEFREDHRRAVDAAVTRDPALFQRSNAVVAETDDNHILVRPITAEEVWNAVRTAPNRCPGTDGVYNIMLRRAPIPLLDVLAKLYTASLHLGYTPTAWKLAETVMIPKPGKDHTEPANYRPISLLSVLAKLQEKILAFRMSNYFEARGLLSKVQCGFRRNRSTQDQLLRLSQFLTEASNQKHFAYCVSLDVAKAFDSVWHNGLRYKLCDRRWGLPRKLVRFLSDYLCDRMYRVRVNGSVSGWRPVRAGVPQGGSLSPLLFILFVNDMPLSLEPVEVPLVGTSQFADDLALWSKSRSAEVAVRRLQKHLDNISDYCATWRVALNVRKTQSTLFHLHRDLPEQMPPPCTLRGQPIAYSRELKFLGVTFDPKLTFGPHMEDVRKRCKHRLHVLASVCGRGFGPQPSTAVRLYKVYIRPLIEYGSAAWYPLICRTRREILERIQNQGCRIAHRFPMWSPRDQLRRLSRTTTVEERLRELGRQYLRKAVHNVPIMRDLVRNRRVLGADLYSTPTPVDWLLN